MDRDFFQKPSKNNQSRIYAKPQNLVQMDEHKSGCQRISESFEKKIEYTTVFAINTQTLISKVREIVLRALQPFSFIASNFHYFNN